MAAITRLPLHWQILIAIGLAAVAGSWAGETGAIGGITWLSLFDFLGTMFINALKMLIVPLISSSIIVGVAGIGATGDLGKLGTHVDRLAVVAVAIDRDQDPGRDLAKPVEHAANTEVG